MINLEKLRRSAAAIFVAVGEAAAMDISQLLLGAIDEIEALRNKLNQAERVIKLAELACPSCENFHHSKEDQHSSPNCPIAARYDAALKEYRS